MAYTKGQKTQLQKNFVSTEFDCHGGNCCRQTLIDSKLVEYIQQIRNHFGKPVIINSGYRCELHNKNVGGATGSRHTKGQAADIAVSGTAPADVAKYAESLGILGIGLYETVSDGYFVHIDTRNYKSYWYGQGEAPRNTFGGTPFLKKGSKGNDVAALQRNLITLKYDLSPYNDDGDFGSKTESALMKFQKDNDMPCTGVFDEITEAKLSVRLTEASYLKKGDSGERVSQLQTNLIKLGYSLPAYGADGDFGLETEKAVKLFQQNNNLPVSGIVDIKTSKTINLAINSLNYKVKVTASSLNVRQGPGMQYKIIAQLKKDAVCTIYEEQNGWGHIVGSGWFNLNYTKKV